MITDDDLNAALGILKVYCKQVEDCDECPLCINDTCQIKTINNKFPKDWKVEKKVEL